MNSQTQRQALQQLVALMVSMHQRMDSVIATLGRVPGLTPPGYFVAARQPLLELLHRVAAEMPEGETHAAVMAAIADIQSVPSLPPSPPPEAPPHA